jgi:flagellar biosynthesis/type III secretory pathway protein FliH
MKTAIQQLSETASKYPNGLFDVRTPDLINLNAVCEAMEEHASQRTAEKDREIERLQDELLKEMGLRAGLELMKERLQKELSDFKALVKQMREKQEQRLKKPAIVWAEQVTDLETQVDKYLQE